MANPYVALKKLLPDQPLLIGTVTAFLSDGRSSVDVPGGVIVVRGQSVAVGQKAFVRNGIVEGGAPALSEQIIVV
ncbi:MAG: hypothetical protein PHR16_14110 [Methylovulum sp.]|nr:hypothetical protein [Methylovulum sp.]